jgi:hypothetical protein
MGQIRLFSLFSSFVVDSVDTVVNGGPVIMTSSSSCVLLSKNMLSREMLFFITKGSRNMFIRVFSTAPLFL